MNNKRNIVITFTLIVLLISFLVSCSSNKFNSDYESFEQSYLKVTNVLVKIESLESIRELNNETILKEFDNMRSILLKLKKEASSKEEKGIYDNFAMYFDGLEFLLYAADNIDTLSEDERGRVHTELIIISMYRRHIKRGE